MAKPISWIPRLVQIRSAVEKADVSHFDRSDIERIFELQPRAALRLLETLPRSRSHGRAVVVERDVLLRFVAEIERTGKVPLRKAKVSRKRLRLTVRPAREVVKGSVERIPGTVRFEPDEVRIHHKGAEDLIAQLWTLALAARDDEERFRGMVSPAEPARKPQVKESDAIERDIREREAEYARKKKAS